MLTKTRKITQEKNDLETNHSFSIPKKIQEKINERWFAIYNWIWEQDVKQSIERDFLKVLNSLWIIGAFILIVPTIILLYMQEPGAYLFFWMALLGINTLFFIYLSFLAIRRSSILRKNSQILITDKAVSINWKIKAIKENRIYSNQNLNHIANLFEEPLFWESNIAKSKKWFTKEVMDKLTSGYGKILRMWSWRSKNSWQLVIVLLWLYTAYVLSLWLIYFVWIIFIWIFWNILTYINKQILLSTGHEITTINNHFENIDKYSARLIKEKEILSNLLNKAKKNDWKDSLLLEINSWIKKINKNASLAVNNSLELKQKIQKSRYKKMFNFNIYNSWIKKQILTPLEQIKDLLNTNLLKLEETLKQITIQIKETTDSSLSWPLTANKLRIEKKIVDIKKHMKAMDIYINKLR